MKAFLISIFIFCGMALHAQIPEALIGAWINEKTNEWEYGFFEAFAIYENDFWDYESIKQKGNKTKLALKKGEQTVLLDIETGKNKSVLRIKNGKNKAQPYIMAGTILPDYPAKDDTPFATPTFTQDSVTIKGYYRHFDQIPENFKQFFGVAAIIISIPDFVTEKDSEHITDIDSLGRFAITVPTVNAQEAYLDWGRLSKMVILEPGSDLFLFADMNDILPIEGESRESHRERPKQIIFMGKNARINNELLKFNVKWHINTSDDSVKKLSHLDFLKLSKEALDKDMQYLNEYITQHPTVSEKFRYYRTENERYRAAFNLMQRRFMLKRNPEERFPEAYMEYVNELFSNTDEKVFTLISYYRSFLRDYMDYVSDRTWQTVGVDLNMVSEKLEADGTITEEIREDVAKYNDFMKAYEALTDSLEKIQLAESFKEFFEKISDNELITETIQTLFVNIYFKAQIETIDAYITHPRLKELYTASLYYKMFDESRIPLDNVAMKVFNERIQTPYLRKTLLDINDNYASINEQVIEHEESLINTDHLESVTEYDELFRRLTENYQGKVIYLDFWGTWCGPCRENMMLMGDIKEALSDKEVIFMYLANNSPDRTWRNVIKEMKLTGVNIVHYNLPRRQQELLERHLSVRSWPTYMLIDRNGNIINAKAPSPREKEKLISEIEQLL